MKKMPSPLGKSPPIKEFLASKLRILDIPKSS